MPHGQRFQDPILVIDEAPLCKNQHRKALVVFTQKVNDFLTRPRPANPFYVQFLCKFRKRRKHAFHECAVPTVENFVGIRRVFKTGLEQVERVTQLSFLSALA